MADNLITVRISRSSEIGKLIYPMFEQDGVLLWDEINALSKLKRTPWALKQFADQTTNLSIDNDDVSMWMDYTPVKGSVTTVQHADIHNNGNPQIETELDDELAVPIIWPDAPIIPEINNQFVEPSWFDRLEKMSVKAGRSIALEGPASVGKDTAVEELAARNKKPLVKLNPAMGLRDRHIYGSQQIRNGRTFYHAAEPASAAIHGWWLIITEFNMANPDVGSFVNSLIETPRFVSVNGITYPVHKDFRLFISYNHGFHGTKPINSATKSRFYPIKVPFFTKRDVKTRLRRYGSEDCIPERDLEHILDFFFRMWDLYANKRQIHYQVHFRSLLSIVEEYRYGLASDWKSSIRSCIVEDIDSERDVAVAVNILNTI